MNGLRPVIALGQLKAKEAVPLLLEYVEYPYVIEALEEIGDARAIASLQEMVSAKGRINSPDVKIDPERERERVASARIALVSLVASNRTETLCELLTEKSFTQHQRREVVWRLGRQPDPKAIPYLAKAIKNDPSGAVVNQSITVLAAFKYKAAVEALIDSFDADFKGKSDWKRAYKPEMFRDNIGVSLHTLTGQSCGADKERWLKWWKEHRNALPELK